MAKKKVTKTTITVLGRRATSFLKAGATLEVDELTPRLQALIRIGYLEVVDGYDVAPQSEEPEPVVEESTDPEPDEDGPSDG